MYRWWLSALAFLLACEVATVPVTFTPAYDVTAPSIVLPTVRPYQTATFAAPTPTREIGDVPCDSLNGWTVSPHCGLAPWFVTVNSNSDLIAISGTDWVTVQLPNNETTRRQVDQPAPPTLYKWVFDTTGYHGTNIIAALPPIVSHNGAGFELNITSLTGRAALRLESTELFTPPGRYVVGLELTPVLTLPDSSRSNPALLRKQCRIYTDTGKQYDLPVQNAGHNQYQPLLDSAVYVIAIDRPLAIVMECGILIEQPIFNGVVVFERMFVEPVPPEYGEVVTLMVQ